MAGAALFRSVASKIAPPRLVLQEGLQLHGRRLLGPQTSSMTRLWLSTSSKSRTSTPLYTNATGSTTRNKKVPNELDWAKDAALEIAPKIAYFFAFTSTAFIVFYVNPKLESINAKLEANQRLRKKLMDQIDRLHEQLESKGKSKGKSD